MGLPDLDIITYNFIHITKGKDFLSNQEINLLLNCTLNCDTQNSPFDIMRKWHLPITILLDSEEDSCLYSLSMSYSLFGDNFFNTAVSLRIPVVPSTSCLDASAFYGHREMGIYRLIHV